MSYLRGDRAPMQMGVWFVAAGGSHFLSHLVLDAMKMTVETDDE
jgi:fructoselysine-6-P-deglycase FrlB-like protein